MRIIDLHPDDPVLKRTFSELEYPFVRLIAEQKVTISCTLERPIDKEVFFYTNLLSQGEETSELYPMETKDGVEYFIDFEPKEVRKGFLRVIIESDQKNEYHTDAFPPTAVDIQPKGLDVIKMYSMIPLASGHMRNWNAKLREIKKMGFDCVHLLPITKMGESQSPYSASDLYEIDPMYVDSQEDFETFIRNAKSLKMRLCFDLVLNHISPDSQLLKDNPDWIIPDTTESDGFKRAGCWHENSWIRWDDLVLINFDHPDITTRHQIWAELKKYTMYWARYAMQTDGMIRLDNLHSSNEGFITHIRAELKKVFPELIVFAEFFADEKTLTLKTYEWDLNLLLGQPWHHDFIPQLRSYFEEIHRQSLQLHHVMPITTHDTPSIQQMYSDACYTIPRYASSSFLSCGKTGITMGVETGESEKLKFIGKPYEIDLFKEHPFKEEIRKINELLDQENVLRQNGNLKFIDKAHHAILLAYREDLSNNGEDLIVAISMDKHHDQTFVLDVNSFYPNILRSSSFREITAPESHPEYARDGDVITLAPCGYKLFKLMK